LILPGHLLDHHPTNPIQKTCQVGLCIPIDQEMNYYPLLQRPQLQSVNKLQVPLNLMNLGVEEGVCRMAARLRRREGQLL
jgi:hypothetical protein